MKTLDGDEYTGSYEPKVESCGLVTITQNENAPVDAAGKRVLRYKVCDDANATRLSSLLPAVGPLLASRSR